MAGPSSLDSSSVQVHAKAIIHNIVKHYYNPRSATPEASNTALIDNSTTEIFGEAPPETTLLSHDSTLTAFAQLACLKLDCQRALISLIDLSNQYILAEATRSVSLTDPNKALPGDGLFLGARKLDLQWGICPETIHIFSVEDSSRNLDTENIIANHKFYLVNNLAEADGFANKPYVTGPPCMRFYVEVPLKTKLGYVIGSFCVADDQPRTGRHEKLLSQLAEIASATANYLEFLHSQSRSKCSQTMMKGLGRFVDGKSVREWWKDAFNESFTHLEDLKRYDEERPPGFTATVTAPSEQIETETAMSDPDIMPAIERQEGLKNFDSTAATASLTTRAQTNVEDFQCLTRVSSLHYETIKYLEPETVEVDESKTSLKGDASNQESLAQAAIKQLFSRASHLVTESSDLDGILFIDASLQDIAVVKGKRAPSTVSALTPGHTGLFDRRSGSNVGKIMRQTTGTIDELIPRFFAPNDPSKKDDPGVGNGQLLKCELLGYCSQEGNGHRPGALPTPQQLSLPQSTLRGLLRKYPYGRIFHFDEDGSLLASQEELTLRKSLNCNPDRLASKLCKFEKEKEQIKEYQLLDYCPGARAVIFFPLWDPQKDQWFAGSLAWTKDSARILQSDDVAFLAAFGSCIMAEKSKMDALTSDRAKTDFISSVSHELRSPLHGMLATMESLEDTIINAEQNEMIRTASTCGEVLLDTLDHILDYAKLSSSRRIKRLKLGEDPRTGSSHYSGRITCFDLSNLVESVVEGIFVGHRYRITTDRHRRSSVPKVLGSTPPNMNPDVMVVLEIESRLSWLFESQIGAWKRILTNIFGNALKYTETGFVKVLLRAEPAQKDKHEPGDEDLRISVVLDIEDSGIGMSQDFLRHRLYMPFSQADPNSVGTGLGLSIVRQLINDLEGKIVFESEAGYGTGVKISVPLNPSGSEFLDAPAVGNMAVIRDIAVWCKGLTLCLIGFDHYPDIDETPTGILSVRARRMLAIRSSIQTFAEDWFGLEIVTACSLAEARGSILMGVQSQLKLSEKSSKLQPLIVFEDFYSGVWAQNREGVFHLSQPVGPHKLARILGQCLEYRCSNPELSPTPISPLSPASDRSIKASSYGFPPISDDVFLQEVNSAPKILLPEPPDPSRPTNLQGPLLSPPRAPDLLSVPNQKVFLKNPRYTILIVEDNDVNMKILANYMKRVKEEYESAVNGMEAVQKYQNSHATIKIIFMDIAMPVKDGITATREIRRFELENSLPRVRIVALTCFSSEEMQRDAFLSGIDTYLVKPIPMKALKPLLALDPEDVVPPEQF